MDRQEDTSRAWHAALRAYIDAAVAAAPTVAAPSVEWNAVCDAVPHVLVALRAAADEPTSPIHAALGGRLHGVEDHWLVGSIDRRMLTLITRVDHLVDALPPRERRAALARAALRPLALDAAVMTPLRAPGMAALLQVEIALSYDADAPPPPRDILRLRWLSWAHSVALISGMPEHVMEVPPPLVAAYALLLAAQDDVLDAEADAREQQPNAYTASAGMLLSLVRTASLPLILRTPVRGVAYMERGHAEAAEQLAKHLPAAASPPWCANAAAWVATLRLAVTLALTDEGGRPRDAAAAQTLVDMQRSDKASLKRCMDADYWHAVAPRVHELLEMPSTARA